MIKTAFLTPEHEMFAKAAEEFAEREAPREAVREWDLKGEYPMALRRAIARQGWYGLTLPEEYGGTSVDFLFFVLASEALGKYAFDISAMYWIPMFIAKDVAKFGTDRQKQHYLPRFMEGEVTFSFSLTEPNAGSDAFALETRAVRSAGEWVLNGQKVFSTGAHVPDNVIAMSCRTDPGAPKAKGISVILVPNDAPGLEMRLLSTLSRRLMGTNEIFLTDVRVPVSETLGPENEGVAILFDTFTMERATISAAYTAQGQSCVDDAARFARERRQFNQPIGNFQVIRHMLADMQTEVNAARLMTYQVGWLVSRGEECFKEACMAKLFSGEVWQRVANQGMQILGGYAQLPEYDMERYYRDARNATVGGGTSQIQRERIARYMGFPLKD